ncbi:hypothetical protein ACFQ60_48155 [Streptomyces zhihengii]
MTVRGGRDFVKNGDTWTVQQILPSNDIVARHIGHRGRIRLPADYVAAHCELGYASTIHRSQGMTVDTSHALASARSTRADVYVQLTRGARTNRLYVALEDGAHLDDALAAIAARRRAHVPATETIAALQQDRARPRQLSAEYADVAERATTARLTGLLEHALGPDQSALLMAADAYPPSPAPCTTPSGPGSICPPAVEHRAAARLRRSGRPCRGTRLAAAPPPAGRRPCPAGQPATPLAHLTLAHLHPHPTRSLPPRRSPRGTHGGRRRRNAPARAGPHRTHPPRLGPAPHGRTDQPRTRRPPRHDAHPDRPRPDQPARCPIQPGT